MRDFLVISSFDLRDSREPANYESLQVTRVTQGAQDDTYRIKVRS